MNESQTSIEGENLDLVLDHLKSEESQVFKDFTNLRETFSREIGQLENKRLSLIEAISELESKEDDNANNDEIVEKNLAIYKNNIAEIKKRLKALNKRENWIKRNYAELISGKSNHLQQAETAESESLTDTFYNLIKDNIKGSGQPTKSKIKDLQHKKEEFLETLQKLFKDYDRELVNVDKERTKLEKLNKEINEKQNNAIQLKKELKNSSKSIAKQLSKKERELEKTLNEEKILIAEFQKIIQNIRADLNVSDIITKILLPPGNSKEKPEETVAQNSDENQKDFNELIVPEEEKIDFEKY